MRGPGCVLVPGAGLEVCFVPKREGGGAGVGDGMESLGGFYVYRYGGLSGCGVDGCVYFFFFRVGGERTSIMGGRIWVGESLRGTFERTGDVRLRVMGRDTD